MKLSAAELSPRARQANERHFGRQPYTTIRSVIMDRFMADKIEERRKDLGMTVCAYLRHCIERELNAGQEN